MRHPHGVKRDETYGALADYRVGGKAATGGRMDTHLCPRPALFLSSARAGRTDLRRIIARGGGVSNTHISGLGIWVEAKDPGIRSAIAPMSHGR